MVFHVVKDLGLNVLPAIKSLNLLKVITNGVLSIITMSIVKHNMVSEMRVLSSVKLNAGSGFA